ncbi:MAG: YjgP/YjgQ family permease [bacterium]
MFKRVDRLILGEVWQPFLFGLFSFSILIVSATMLKSTLDFMIKFNLPFSLFAKLVLLGIPQVVALSFPMSVLLGTLLGIGRLNNDSEIIALRAAGISLLRAAAAVAYFGVAAAGITFFLSEGVAPGANSAIVRIKNEVLLRKTGAVNQENLVLPFYEGGQLTFLLLAEKLEGDKLTGIKFFNFGPTDQRSSWITAETGVWQEDHWVFHNGSRYQVMQEGSVLTSTFDILDIRELEIKPSGLTRKAKTSLEMSISELRAYINDLQREGLEREAAKARVEYYFKFSTPFASVFFVLIAFPLAISAARTTGGTGMGIAVLIVLVYYVITVVAMKLGQAGAIQPLLASWIPNAIVAAAGAYLFRVRNR